MNADAPITANSAKHSAHTTGHSSTPISDCSNVRASHDVSGSGHSAIASGAATNSSASSVASTIFVTISSRKITTATTAAIVPMPSGVKLETVAAAEQLRQPGLDVGLVRDPVGQVVRRDRQRPEDLRVERQRAGGDAAARERLDRLIGARRGEPGGVVADGGDREDEREQRPRGDLDVRAQLVEVAVGADCRCRPARRAATRPCAA